MTRRVNRTRSSKTTRRRVARTREARRMAVSQAQDAEGLGASVQPTAVAVESLRTGVVEASHQPDHSSIAGREGDAMRAGDPDVSSLANEYSGEELPGASAPTPDQNDVDDIGHAYGVEDADTGALRTSQELLAERDRRRR